jgi:prepilin-type N-terminal cleavage/methylation domain-containing protein
MSPRTTTALPATKSFGHRSDRGFNLLELIAVLAVIGFVAAAGYPALTRILQRERVEGFLRSATVAVEKAKGEAAKRSVPAVVRADYAHNSLYGFADLDRDGRLDSDEPQILFLPLPAIGDKALRFWSALDAAAEGDGAVLGFSPDPESADAPNQAILLPDGSARAAGAFRFGLGGKPGNFYELRVEPAATARVQLRKYLTEGEPAFMARNPGEAAAWPWY